MTRRRSPIPAGVWFDRRLHQFYTLRGMLGTRFYMAWRDRAWEFPTEIRL
ncbi:hypothetical protein HMSP1_4 [Sinorhizobium phage HMSP1-Susan]|nr:hypothetical protein HMSP1_4 [Sinorhizobium phage HMSP1-Susan]